MPAAPTIDGNATATTLQRGATWCNDCNGTCATDGCTASCAVADLPEYFTLLAYFAAGALAFAAVALLALRIRAVSSSKANLKGRGALCVLLALGSFPQVATQYFALFDRDGAYAGVPPCVGSYVAIGLWTSGYNGVPTADFLATCPSGGSEIQLIAATRIASIAAFVCAAAACFALIGFTTPVPAGVAVTLHALLLVVTVALMEAAHTLPDFCGSGTTLRRLFFHAGPAAHGVYAAAALCALGLLTTAVMYYTCRRCFDAVEANGAEERAVGATEPIEGVVVQELDSAAFGAHPDSPAVDADGMADGVVVVADG